MKKMIALLLVLGLMFTLVACADEEEPPTNESPREEAPYEPYAPEEEELASPVRPVEGVTAAGVRAEYVDEDVDLSQFNGYHSFVEAGIAEDLRVVITTELPIYDFHFVELGYTEFDAEDGESDIFKHATILYSLEELSPETPFVVNIEFLCWNSNRGIVFRDADFTEYIFEIVSSGYDGAVMLLELEWHFLRSPRTAVTGLIEDQNRAWTEITVSQNVGWSAETESILWETYTLNQADAEALMEMLSQMDAVEILTPFYRESQQADPFFKIEITYADGDADIIFNIEENSNFFRFTGTFGSHGDPGYVIALQIESLFAFLLEQF